jgi:exopolysaccharide production protein ExoZ
MTANLRPSRPFSCENGSKQTERLTSPRLLGLDAIRQIAAMVVLVQHYFVIFEIAVPTWLTSGILDAKAAVTLFFVLSGYVLALSVRREPLSFKGYVNFGIRRVLRLYPMHFAATFLAMVVLLWIKKQGGFDRPLLMPVGFLDASHFDIRQWILQFSLVMPGMNSDFANPPVWTLMTEGKVSIVFPFLAWAVLRLPSGVSCALVAVLVLGSDLFARHLVGTFALLGQFGVGALIARLRPGCMAGFRWRAWTGWIVLSLALYCCVSLRYQLPSVWIAYYLGSFGAAGIIIAAVNWEFLNLRLTRVQRFFRADISYGLYILHFPLMLWLRKLSGETTTALSAWGWFALSLLLTVVLSVVLMILVEKPAIELGKRLTGRRPVGAP